MEGHDSEPVPNSKIRQTVDSNSSLSHQDPQAVCERFTDVVAHEVGVVKHYWGKLGAQTSELTCVSSMCAVSAGWHGLGGCGASCDTKPVPCRPRYVVDTTTTACSCCLSTLDSGQPLRCCM
eukprot:915187-Amphidinium_carterae.1